jgi:ribosomal protein S13
MEIIIDTLKIYERLKAADLNEKAAKEIAEVIREVSLESQKGLTTKGDLAILEGRLNEQLASLNERTASIEGELKLSNGCWAFLLLESYL